MLLFFFFEIKRDMNFWGNCLCQRKCVCESTVGWKRIRPQLRMTPGGLPKTSLPARLLLDICSYSLELDSALPVHRLTSCLAGRDASKPTGCLFSPPQAEQGAALWTAQCASRTIVNASGVAVSGSICFVPRLVPTSLLECWGEVSSQLWKAFATIVWQNQKSYKCGARGSTPRGATQVWKQHNKCSACYQFSHEANNV